MAEWWEEAPLAEPTETDDWWASAPLADQRQQSGIADRLLGGLQDFAFMGGVVTGQEDPRPDRLPEADIIEQAGAGTQQGIASGLGFPVDAVSGAISGLGDITGLWEPIDRPILGSEHIDSLISPLREGVPDPQTGGQRMARRVGQEVGAASALGPAAAVSPAARARPAMTAGLEAASALGSGAGAATANEIFPGSQTADIIGSLAGGLPIAGAAGYMAPGRQAGIIDGVQDQRARARDAYGTVRSDTGLLPQQEVTGLASRMRNRAVDAGMDDTAVSATESLHPKAFRAADIIDSRASRPSRIEEVEEMRRLTQRNVGSSPNPDEARISREMIDEIDDYLETKGGAVVEALTEGRDAHRRASAAQTILDATNSARLQAGSTGTGGNEINAIRQKLRQIVDNPRRRKSFKKDELDMMERIVMGTEGENAARFLSRLSPTSGGLAPWLHLMGANTLGVAPSLALSGITQGAKTVGESMTRKSVDELVNSLAPSRVGRAGEAGLSPAIAALLGARQLQE